MSRFIVLILLLAITATAFSQDLKEITNRYPKSKAIKERYHVLKSDKKVRWGSYEMYHENGRIKIQGQYYEGLEKGIWTTYDEQGNVVEAGNYIKGKKTGQWNYFKEDGQVLVRYDHDNDMALPPVIQMRVKYPLQATLQYKTGTVFISYEVNEDCSLGEITVVRGLGYGCDEEAIRLTKLKHEFEMKYRVEEGPCMAGALEHAVKFTQSNY